MSQSASSQEAKKPESAYDRIWKFTELYKDDSNPVVQAVLFTGRFQLDHASLDADQGDVGEWNVRRLRLGPRITFFHTLTLHAEVELNPQERDPLYQRLTDAYVQWSPNRRFVTTVGKQSAPFTIDGATSSKELLAIDRSNLANNMWFPQEYMPGVSLSGRTAAWVYRAGVYSSGAADREFGRFNGGHFFLGVIGYDFARKIDARQALVSFNYVRQSADPNNTFTRQLGDIVSANVAVEKGRWGTRADVSSAAGYLGQSDLVGVMLMPYVNITPKLQAVGRYTMLDGDGANGVRLATYESRLVSGRGDRYDETYVGANYYFYGHKLKLQTGLQHAAMDDSAGDGGEYSGWSWTSALRVSW